MAYRQTIVSMFGLAYGLLSPLGPRLENMVQVYQPRAGSPSSCVCGLQENSPIRPRHKSGPNYNDDNDYYHDFDAVQIFGAKLLCSSNPKKRLHVKGGPTLCFSIFYLE